MYNVDYDPEKFDKDEHGNLIPKNDNAGEDAIIDEDIVE